MRMSKPASRFHAHLQLSAVCFQAAHPRFLSSSSLRLRCLDADMEDLYMKLFREHVRRIRVSTASFLHNDAGHNLVTYNEHIVTPEAQPAFSTISEPACETL